MCKRRLIRNADRLLIDEVVICQYNREAARAAQKEKQAKAAMRPKGKPTRPNYKDMPQAEYIIVRHNDWYASALRNEEIECRNF
jgi:hypothetical protein